jgi:hypothetical protein
MRTATLISRSICAAALALLLSIRLLSPAGFMPAFDRIGITIVACPDADGGAMPMHKHHGKTLHEPCPYAYASALSAIGADWTPFVLEISFVAALILGRPFPFVEQHQRRERPPSIGPPIAA